jgi:hypothetical protein
MVEGAATAPKIIAFAERLNERQRNLLRLWACRRLRDVRGGAEDSLEETLAEWTASGLEITLKVRRLRCACDGLRHRSTEYQRHTLRGRLVA